MSVVSPVSPRPAAVSEPAVSDEDCPVGLSFRIDRTRFDETYVPPSGTRLTTNYANLARGERRRENLRSVLEMIDARFNDLADWDNPDRDRYTVELEIISVGVSLAAAGDAAREAASDTTAFPLIEMLQTTIVDRTLGRRIPGVAGNNLSSYVRDYDFSILLPRVSGDTAEVTLPEDFGQLHGNLFRAFLASDAYAHAFDTAPVVCLSVSSTKTYHRTDNHHPILGVEYRQDEYSFTDRYFAKMGLGVRYFMPPGGAAPLAFYFRGDLLSDYGILPLVATVSTMETFQKIYRPEIYNANAAAGSQYRPRLEHTDYSTTQITYDRDERARLALEQGRFIDDVLITPRGERLQRWSERQSAHRGDPEKRR